MDVNPPEPPDPGEAFLRLLSEHERSLAAYVYTLLAGASDADDVLQECKVVMWKQFSQFKPGTNFRAWGRAIALHQILNFRRAEKRKPFSSLDHAFVEGIAAEIDRRPDQLDRKAEVLQLCLRKLPEAHRAIVVWRYYEDQDVDAIAARSHRSVEAVYRLLSRTRRILNECISRQLAATANSP